MADKLQDKLARRMTIRPNLVNQPDMHPEPVKKVTIIQIGNPFGSDLEHDAGPAVSDKSSKASAGYLPPVEGGFKCANCIFFQRGDGPGHGGIGSCKLVEGKIDPQGCCNLFEGPNECYLDEEAAENEEGE